MRISRCKTERFWRCQGPVVIYNDSRCKLRSTSVGRNLRRVLHFCRPSV